MDSTFRILELDADLARHIGYPHVLAEALEMVGSAVLIAVYVPPPYAAAGAVIVGLIGDDKRAIEAAFTAQAPGGDYLAARHAMGPARAAAKPLRASQRWAGMAGRARRSA
jgi:hypothetical protein